MALTSALVLFIAISFERRGALIAALAAALGAVHGSEIAAVRLAMARHSPYRHGRACPSLSTGEPSRGAGEAMPEEEE
jgi:hypothetical protein